MTLYIACCEQLESKDGTRHSWTKAVWSFAKIGHREMPFYEAEHGISQANAFETFWFSKGSQDLNIHAIS